MTMKLPDEDARIAAIAAKFEQPLKAAEDLFNFVQASMNGVVPKAGARTNLCLASIMTRLLRLHYAAIKLAASGVASEGKIPVRAMFELVVNLYALQQAGDKEEYARKWIAWDLHNYMKQIEVELRHHPELAPQFLDHQKLAEEVKTDLDAEAREEAETKFGKDKAAIEKRVKGKWKEFLNHGPSMLDLWSLSSRVDRDSKGTVNLCAIYERLYPNASGVIHGSDLATMVERDDKGGIVLKLAPTEDSVETVVVTSTILLAMGSKVILRELGIEPKEMDKRIDECCRAVLGHAST